jgi:predicted membrane channel-forming protein YqfA (hemolysin III family)
MMKNAARILAYVALGLTVVPSIAVMMGSLSHDTHITLMTAGMILWFIAAPVWMKKS